MSAKVCVVLSVVALAMFGPLSVAARPGYAAAYDNVDYYVSANRGQRACRSAGSAIML